MDLWYTPNEIDQVQQLIKRWDSLEISSNEELRRALLFIQSQPELKVVSDMMNQLTTNLEYISHEEEELVEVEQKVEVDEMDEQCEATDLDLYEEEQEQQDMLYEIDEVCTCEQDEHMMFYEDEEEQVVAQCCPCEYSSPLFQQPISHSQSVNIKQDLSLRTTSIATPVQQEQEQQSVDYQFTATSSDRHDLEVEQEDVENPNAVKLRQTSREDYVDYVDTDIAPCGSHSPINQSDSETIRLFLLPFHRYNNGIQPRIRF